MSTTTSYNQLLDAYSSGRPPENLDSEMDTYLKNVQNKNGEHNKRAYLKSKILEGWLDIPSEVIGFEEDKNDMWVNGIIVETKTDLSSSQKRKDAKQKCLKYRKRRKSKGQVVERCILTDGVQFEIYRYYTPESGSTELVQEDGFELQHKPPNKGFEALYDAFFPQNVELPMEESVVFTRFYTKFQPYINQLEEEVDSTGVEYRAWKSYLASVFGESMDDESLTVRFSRQTYLYILSVVVSARAVGIEETRYEKLFRHETFLDVGVYGLIENTSFFHWVPTELGNSLVEAIDKELSNFNFDEQKGDFFRLLYENAISPDERHALGEFYTPYWLASTLTDHVDQERGLEDEVVLDPACGSGTFPKLAIEHKLNAGKDISEITSSVIGFDINPIAVSIARANYLLAIHEQLKDADSWVKIPIFLADALMPDAVQGEDESSGEIIHPDNNHAVGVRVRFSDVASYADDKVFWYDERASLEEIDQQIFQLSEAALGNTSIDELGNGSENSQLLFDENEELVEQWVELVENDDNHIWSYILQNVYTPNYFRGEVDVILGNPPWLTYKDIQIPGRQELLDSLYDKYNMGSGWHVKTQQDMGAFFITRCQEFFDQEVYMAFVFTRSLFNGSQYDPLRRGSWDGPTVSTLFDIDSSVNPFRVPSCMVVLEDSELNMQIDGYQIRGDD